MLVGKFYELADLTKILHGEGNRFAEYDIQSLAGGTSADRRVIAGHIDRTVDRISLICQGGKGQNEVDIHPVEAEEEFGNTVADEGFAHMGHADFPYAVCFRLPEEFGAECLGYKLQRGDAVLPEIEDSKYFIRIPGIGVFKILDFSQIRHCIFLKFIRFPADGHDRISVCLTFLLRPSFSRKMNPEIRDCLRFVIGMTKKRAIRIPDLEKQVFFCQ